MKITEYRENFLRELETLYGRHEAESFFSLGLEHFRKLKRLDLALHPELTLSENEVKTWDSFLQSLKMELPVQYLLGKAHFGGLEFEVGPDVLIPRPETEELVEWILAELSKNGNAKPTILDIGTGSGCIAVTLAKKLPVAEVAAIDVSEKALAVANRNAGANGVEVEFIGQDILAAEKLSRQYDVIVSNPPYVRNLEKHEIRKNVLDHEPHLALFVDDNDALLFYRKISSLALDHLTENGMLFFEINQYLAKETMDMLEESGFGFLELRKDIYGNQRMILAKKN